MRPKAAESRLNSESGDCGRCEDRAALGGGVSVSRCLRFGSGNVEIQIANGEMRGKLYLFSFTG